MARGAALELAAIALGGLGEHVLEGRLLLLAAAPPARARRASASSSGTAMPACCARSLTASMKPMPCCSIRKPIGVAVDAAAEAVIGLARRADGEARRLLAVEGAQALAVGAGALQLDRAADDLDDVDAGRAALDEGGGITGRS